MIKAEAEAGIKQLVRQWARINNISHGQDEMPSFSEFQAWVFSEGYGRYFDFKSRIGADEEAEMWFDRELGQSWRN